MQYADIIIDISHEKVDRIFQYRIPDKLLDRNLIGECVEIPFGKGDKIREGYVVGVSDETDYPVEKIKEIKGLSQKSVAVESRNIKLAWFIKKRYGSTMISALKTVLPVKQKVKQQEYKEIVLKVSQEMAKELLREADAKKQNAKVRVLNALLDCDTISQSMLAKMAVSSQTIRSLEAQGIVETKVYQTFRNPVHVSGPMEIPKPLTSAQEQIVDDFLKDYDAGNLKPALLFGVTGSGKTEVYLSIIEGMLKRGKQVIVLIPEISLTYQTVLRFYKRFGNIVSLVNSRLSQGEKYDQFERAQKGEVQIMIGPRSALFTPFQSLGLVIIDEEQENSYKSDSMPKYHAREVAEYLTKICGGRLLMGSATPSLEANYKAEMGEYKKYRLDERVGSAGMPDTEIVDLRQELKEGNFSIFSRRLQEEMQDRLSKGEQIILFLNRRGTAGFISCKSCGYVMKCPHCDVSLSEHGSKMICHYCGYETIRPDICPECGSKYIFGFKAGTIKVEENIQKMFPKAKVLRLDADTTKKKDDYEKILSAFSQKEADILIGTQMIVKGHDFSNVTLMGILAADMSLFASDYRSSERTFQLLVQAVGRAGRKDKKGLAIIQTYSPDQYSIVLSAKQDYDAFYKKEIEYRKLMNYPPAGQLLAVLFMSKIEKKCLFYSGKIAQVLKAKVKEMGTRSVIVMGPAPASIGKINDYYRQVIYINAQSSEELEDMRACIEQLVSKNEETMKNVLVYYDVNPANGY